MQHGTGFSLLVVTYLAAASVGPAQLSYLKTLFEANATLCEANATLCETTETVGGEF